MDNPSQIVEVAFFGGKVLVTFGDGMIALLEPSAVRRLAVEANALTSPPPSALTSGASE
jgi:hypothetical protein